jgi:hypothetical protein
MKKKLLQIKLRLRIFLLNKFMNKIKKTTKRSISSEELNAKLDLAKKINETFPFIKDHFRILSAVTIDKRGIETGVLTVEIFTKHLQGGEMTMSTMIGKDLNKILSQDIKKQNDMLRKGNKELKIKLEKYEKKI